MVEHESTSRVPAAGENKILVPPLGFRGVERVLGQKKHGPHSLLHPLFIQASECARDVATSLQHYDEPRENLEVQGPSAPTTAVGGLHPLSTAHPRPFGCCPMGPLPLTSPFNLPSGWGLKEVSQSCWVPTVFFAAGVSTHPPPDKRCLVHHPTPPTPSSTTTAYTAIVLCLNSPHIFKGV